MGLKEKMGDWMMGNMKPEEKKEMMDAMMDNFFAQTPPEDKQKMMEGMMDKFFSGISAEEKSKMMLGMMKNMMGGGGFSMRDMMQGMMGGRREAGEGLPWDMCQKMMSSINASSEMASFATPEVRSLFNDWAEQIEGEMLHYIQEKKTADPAELAAHFKISQPSASFFLNRLVQKGKIHLKAEKL